MEVEVIKQLKSWLSVNPIIGCPLECKYCYRHDNDIFSIKKPKQIQSDEETLNELLNHRLFLPNSTPIAIHNMATDPFLKKPKETAFKILEELDELKYKNSTGLITKKIITKDDIAFLESLSNIDVNVLVTYSEMPKNIEPIGNEDRKKSLKNLSESKIKTVIYWRPLIKGQNTDEKRMETVLEYGENYADAFIVSGLKATPKISTFLENQGIQLEGDFNLNHKYFPEDVLNRMLELYNEKEISTPLFRRTSCAVSYLKDNPDYNAHWSKSWKNCLETCPQKQKCNSVPKPEKNKVEFLLGRLGYDDMEFEIHEKYLKTESNLTKEEKTYLRHNLLFPVKSL